MMFGLFKKRNREEEIREKAIQDMTEPGKSSDELSLEMLKPGAFLRPVPYEACVSAEEIKSELDTSLEELFNGEIDSANGNVLDNIIRDRTLQIITDYDKQRLQHIDIITAICDKEMANTRRCQERRARLTEILQRKLALKDRLDEMLETYEFGKRKGGKNYER